MLLPLEFEFHLRRWLAADFLEVFDRQLALRDDPRLLGYYSDNEMGWWNSALFQLTLEQAPTSGQRCRLLQRRGRDRQREAESGDRRDLHGYRDRRGREHQRRDNAQLQRHPLIVRSHVADTHRRAI